MMKIISIFAAIHAKNHIDINSSGYFYGYTIAALSQDIRLSNPCRLLHLCRNDSWRNMGGDSLSLCKNFYFYRQMPRINENASKVKHSNLTSTPDCESVDPLFLSQVSNLLPKSEQNGQGIGNIGESDVIGCNTFGDKEISSSQLEYSNVQQGNGIEHVGQKSIVTTNTGIAEIYGTGHTITVNQCPDELIQLLIKLIKKL
jgi:hypothetical protein